MFAAHADTNEMLKAILRSIDEGIHVIDKDGRTIYYNEIAADHDGMEASEVLGKPLLNVFPSLSSETSTMLKVIKTGQPLFNHHQTYRNIKGKLIDTVNTTIPIIANGDIHGAVEIAKDYSRVKDLSNKLIELQTKMDKRGEKPQSISKYNTIYQFNDIITADPTMNKVIQQAKKISKTTSPIMVYGETGTGKELLVQGVHHHSSRSHGPFISQNCAAIPPSLLESMLFGSTKGSFTGAENKEGLFELAHGGTLFLDEIHTLPFDLQAKLLRVLEDGVVRRIGSHKAVQTDVRIITATNEPPKQLIEKELLRKDLYYRLNVVALSIPPLRERLSDLPLLTEAFIQLFNHRFHLNVQEIEPKAMKSLHEYDWPGNIRELRHAIESAMNMTDSNTLLLEHFPVYLAEHETLSNYRHASIATEQGLKKAVEDFEKSVVIDMFNKENQNILRTAKKLKIPRQTLQYKLQKYQIL
ncbi:sigma-54-dependent Fis family transcriptional regulator [Salipaludibacillus keqinensis]|uniref:Sigma-54-dependent Fis family transcriptional regulator n=1 Tax=Salipaludibacillus keqinensis TaxID=2045207 RepID=A0A323TJ85_9BACI|nr:sigma 54-interacting transcriptional regulator [Salipaludibacillus keqinensis]PYZ94600.1 sigma-54-dependent Fis family transcriptional regulator [Salipaludibacillus keqinensis]